jgi:Calcineurin-like phosphoesterase
MSLLVFSSSFLSVFAAAEDSFYAVLNDIHINTHHKLSTKRLEHFCEIVPELKKTGLKFLVLNGDLTDNGSPIFAVEDPGQKEAEWNTLYETLIPCMRQVPVLAVPGNHDRFHVESYGHESDLYATFFRKKLKNFQEEHHSENSLEDVETHDSVSPSPPSSSFLISSFEGSQHYGFSSSKNTAMLLDTSTFGVNRHFWARLTDPLANWIDSQLGNLKRNQKVTIFCHFPTGTFVPKSRTKLLAILKKHSNKILSYNSGHIHALLGKKPLALNEAGIKERTLPDFQYNGMVRFISTSNNDHIQDICKDHEIHLKEGIIVHEETGSIHDMNKMMKKHILNSSRLVVEKSEVSWKVLAESTPHVNKISSGIHRIMYLYMYEFFSFFLVFFYLFFVYILYKYKKPEMKFLENMEIFMSLLIPVLPWAAGYGFLDKFCLCGIWGCVNVTTGEHRYTDFTPFPMLPLILSMMAKISMFSINPSNFWKKIIYYFCGFLVAFFTLVGAKLHFLTFGPFISPWFLWEVSTWVIRGMQKYPVLGYSAKKSV